MLHSKNEIDNLTVSSSISCPQCSSLDTQRILYETHRTCNDCGKKWVYAKKSSINCPNCSDGRLYRPVYGKLHTCDICLCTVDLSKGNDASVVRTKKDTPKEPPHALTNGKKPRKTKVKGVELIAPDQITGMGYAVSFLRDNGRFRRYFNVGPRSRQRLQRALKNISKKQNIYIDPLADGWVCSVSRSRGGVQ